MARGLKHFRRILKAFQQDPQCADELVSVVTEAGATWPKALQDVVQKELEDAAANDVGASATAFHHGGGMRLDPVLISPGGVLLQGKHFGKRALSSALNSKIDEGYWMDLLAREPFRSAFAQVRDGLAPISFCDFQNGQVCFLSPTLAKGEARERPDCIYAMFFTADLTGAAPRDRAPNVLPLALGRVIRKFNPARAKRPQEWQIATPERRFVKLRDGRMMATRWYGPANAMPIVVFGAIHKSTMACPLLANAAIARGFALLIVERPGLGASDPAPATSYEAVADDVAEIVLALSLRHVFVYGAGMAASFALAAAARLGGTVKAVALAGPRVGKPTGPAENRYGQLLWRLLTNSFGLDATARLIRHMRAGGSAQALLARYSVSNQRDARVLHAPGMLAYGAAQTNDAVHKSVEGALAEFRLYRSGASFSSAKVNQPIRIWQGEEDRSLLLRDTQRIVDEAPNATLEIVAGGGMLMDETEAAAIIDWLAEGWSAQVPTAKRVVG